MAASCISVPASSVSNLVTTSSVEATGARQAARLTLASPFFGAASSCSLDATAFSSFSLSCKSVRKVGIAARAADLEEAPTAVASAASTKLYVGNLPWSIHSKELAEIFQEVGNVELVEVIYDRDTQKSRGFAFVTMSTVEEAQKAIDALEGSELDGRVIRVSFPQPREPRSDRGERRERPAPRERRGDFSRSNDSDNKLFVGNLSWGVDDTALDELFREHGTVQEARVVCDKDTGRSRGFGFVKFASESECNQAIQALDGAEFDGRPLKVNPAGDKPERRDGPRY